MKNSLFENIFHGAAYYPEVTGLSVLDKDIAAMRDLGINCVRMGEFAWSAMEKREGTYDFSLFDEVIKRLYENGIMTVLCTPTVTPPVWFTEKHPESLYVDKRLHRATHGDREHVCIANDDYRACCDKITEAMAKHFAKTKGIIAWQLHNEINWPARECFCKSCKEKWHGYLREKFGTVERLNEAWGTAVWSNTYFSFDQVIQPVQTYLYALSPSVVTEYARFNQKNVTDFIGRQAAILKRYVTQPITTNLNRLFYINQENIAKHLDFVAYDQYIGQPSCREMMLDCDLYGSMKDAPFFLMETSCSYSGCIDGVGSYHKRGYVAAEAAANLFRGACGFSYWLFRQHYAGVEMPHGHLVNAFGKKSAGSVNVREVSALIRNLEGFLRESEFVSPDCAIVYSSEAKIFYDSEKAGRKGYYDIFVEKYEQLVMAGIPRDVVTEESDLSRYKLIYVPNIPYVSEKLWEKLKGAAERGATVIFGEDTGTRTEFHTLHRDGALGRFEKELGVTSKDYLNLQGTETHCRYGEESFSAEGFCVVFEETQKCLCCLSSDYVVGSLIVKSPFGAGHFVTASSRIPSSVCVRLLKDMAEQCGCERYDMSECMYAVKRKTKSGMALCLVNMGEGIGFVQTEGYSRDRLSGRTFSGKILFRPNECMVLEKISLPF